MNLTERRQRVRDWMAGDQCIYTVNVWDPLSARVAEDVGFELGMLSAHGAEWVVNGAHQLCRVTISELAEQVRRMTRASDLSLMVTGPFGFGNALNEMRYVQDLELAGAAMVTIADIVLPLPFGSARSVRPLDLNGLERRRRPLEDEAEQRDRDHDLELQPNMPLAEFEGRIKAALAVRQDPALVIAARTNAMMLGDVQAAVQRVLAYEKAGAEAVWFTNATREGIEAIHAASGIPLIVGGSVFFEWKDMTLPEIRAFLQAHGVKMASLGANSMRAVLKTLYDSYTAMHDGDNYSAPNQVVTSEQYARAIRLDRDNEAIRNFLN